MCLRVKRRCLPFVNQAAPKRGMVEKPSLIRPVSLGMTTYMQRPGSQSIDIEDLLVWAFRDQQVEAAQAPHPDATTVYWAVMALPAAHTRIICRFARSGLGPEWQAGPGPVVQLDAVRRAHTLYAEWVRAMVVLQRTLDGTLTRYRVSGPRLDEAPWRKARAG